MLLVTERKSSWISDSIRSAPTRFTVSFNSSKVMVPLLSVSIILNSSLSPPISSSDSLSAITRKAIFFSLFIAEKFFKRDSTAQSKGLSGATLSSTIHGWPTKIKKASINHHCVLKAQKMRELTQHLMSS